MDRDIRKSHPAQKKGKVTIRLSVKQSYGFSVNRPSYIHLFVVPHILMQGKRINGMCEKIGRP